MKNIWTEGLTVSDDGGTPVEITPTMLSEINRRMKVQNGYDILSVFVAEPKCTEEQLLAISEKLDEILNCDSGDSERAACIKVLGDDFDNEEVSTKTISLEDFKLGADFYELLLDSIDSDVIINDEVSLVTGGYMQVSHNGKYIMVLPDDEGTIVDVKKGDYKSLLNHERVAEICKALS